MTILDSYISSTEDKQIYISFNGERITAIVDTEIFFEVKKEKLEFLPTVLENLESETFQETITNAGMNLQRSKETMYYTKDFSFFVDLSEGIPLTQEVISWSIRILKKRGLL